MMKRLLIWTLNIVCASIYILLYNGLSILFFGVPLP